MFGTGSVLLLTWWCFAIRKLSLWSPEGEKGFDTFRRVYFWKRIIIWVRMVDATPPWPQPFRNTHPPQLLYPLVCLSGGQQLLAYFEEVIARFNLTCFIPPWGISLWLIPCQIYYCTNCNPLVWLYSYEYFLFVFFWKFFLLLKKLSRVRVLSL